MFSFLQFVTLRHSPQYRAIFLLSTLAAIATYVTNVTNVYSTTAHHSEPLCTARGRVFLLSGCYIYLYGEG